MKSILIIRLSAIGDIVMASPLISAVRASHPHARIAWLVQPEAKVLLEHHPDLDEVIVWPRKKWSALLSSLDLLELWREINVFRNNLQAKKFDLAIDAQGLLKSGILAWISGAKERIGLGSKEGSQYLMTRVIARSGDKDRICSEYIHLASELGFPTDNFEMRVALSKSDEDYACKLIDKQRLHNGYFVICPFTTRPQKHWLEDSWVKLLDQLGESYDLPAMMLGGPDNSQEAQGIERRTKHRLINQVGSTSLRQAAALISQSTLLIGVDTGLTHMGIAFDKPTICLFGSTLPYLETTHDNAIVIYHARDCSPCRRKPICNGRFDCMRAITVNEVLDLVNQLLKSKDYG